MGNDMAMAQSEERVAAGADKPSYGGFIRQHMREYGILFALIAIMAFFQIVTDGVLLKPVNLTNLVLQNSYIVIMAVGMLLVIVSGNIDLSVGSVMGFIGALAAVLMVQYDFHFFAASLVCLLVGMAIGAAQGYWVAYYRIPSFIVTLAGMRARAPSTFSTQAMMWGRSRRPPTRCSRKRTAWAPPHFRAWRKWNATSLASASRCSTRRQAQRVQ
jgi:ABC-type xylose transport system permease subunit